MLHYCPSCYFIFLDLDLGCMLKKLYALLLIQINENFFVIETHDLLFTKPLFLLFL